MAIDALAYTKALEAADISRPAAEAHAAALARHVLPPFVAKADLDMAVERLEHRLTLRMIGTVGVFDVALFALLRFVC